MKKSWEQAVAEAKILVDGIKKNRLKIAELAVEVCDGQHGNQHSQRTGPTITQFATEIGVDRTTLVSWIGALEKYRVKHPKKEPTVQDFKVAIKEFADRPDHERKNKFVTKSIHRESRKFKALLSEVQTFKNFLAEKPDIGSVDLKLRNELIIKLKEIASTIERVGR